MKRVYGFVLALLLAALSLAGCSGMGQSDAGWVTLFDGTHLDNFTRLGDANRRLVDGVVQADKGNGYLVTKQSYTNFQIRAEFWVDDAANSGIFIRMSDRNKVTATNAYEVNIFDKRPDPSYGTGGIVGVAKVSAPVKAGGRWNTYEITAQGSHLVAVLNGVRTADAQDSKFPSGPFALQYGGGVVKFRKVQVRPL
jgi:hypothetical protein